MSDSLKTFMQMDKDDLIVLGSKYGLTFHSGLKKSQMAQQLNASLASGWMEVNKELMSESPDEESEQISFGNSNMLSDAAHAAQIISGAGLSNTFHSVMGSGKSHHVEAIHEYLSKIGAKADDVWMHLPKQRPEEPTYGPQVLHDYLRENLVAHQDIMSQIEGHAESNFMDEYSTNKGGVAASYEHLAHMYLDKSEYIHPLAYEYDVKRVSTRLAETLGERFPEIAYAAATGGKDNKVSYMDALPQIGDKDITKGLMHARQPLNAAGLPLGSTGSAVGNNTQYSLAASLSESPAWSPASKALEEDIRVTTKSLAKVYNSKDKSGDKSAVGMNPTKVQTSERDMILDSASRYEDIYNVRNGYENLKQELGDEPKYSRESIAGILNNAVEYSESETRRSFDPALAARSLRASTNETEKPATNTDFYAQLSAPTSRNLGQERRAYRESVQAADIDAMSSDYVEQQNPIKFHNFEQGSDEWLEFRKGFDITGSTIGSYLGNNAYTSPIKEMSDKIGASERKNTTNFDMERGHRLEPIARQRVSEQFGFDIGETGAITNENFPRMLYSPDGLIGEDAIWEHKAPRKFFDLSEHPDYVDQMQLGMAISGRSRALFSQTVGNETRSQWIERDADWFENNKAKIESTLARMDAGRRFLEENQDMDAKELQRGAREAMTGEGIWGFRKPGLEGYYTGGKRGMSKYSETAGTEQDQFVQSNYESVTRQSELPNLPEESNNSKMADSVKAGILSAQEENERKGKLANGLARPEDVHPGLERTSADEAFDSMMRSASYHRMYAPGGGGRGGNGGGGDDDRDGGWSGQFGEGFGSVARGIAGGSVSSLQNGAMSALTMTPWGRIAAVGIGAVQIGNELADNMNESLGIAQDSGMDNPVEFAAQQQGMEMLGLSEQQASRLAQTTHSAYNTLLNGDPGAAVRIITGTRGLVTMGDLRTTQGDPVALARIIRERGQARGWSQARIAGAMQMAGLDGMARTYDRDRQQSEAEAVRDRGAQADYFEASENLQDLQSSRRAASPTYAIQREAFTNGAGLLRSADDAINLAGTGANEVAMSARNVYDFIAGEESGNRDYDKNGNLITSATGARGRMQVLPSTAAKPGYGIRPSNGTVEDDARVGREYYDALLKANNGDAERAMAAYTDGQGTLDKAVEQARKEGNESKWLTYMPAQARNRVAAYKQWSANSVDMQEGASGFTRNGLSYGQTPSTTINVKIDATVNNKQASATVTSPQGGTVTQSVNMNNGAMTRK